MSPRLIGATLAFVVGFPLLSLAAPMYDFSSLAGPGGSLANLGTTEAAPGILGNINVSGFYLNSGTWSASDLTARNEPVDKGVGVCSPGESCPVGGFGGGDDNELSQLQNNEAILLERPAGTTWAGLWVSSLDNNDAAGAEKGKLYWGNTSDIATLLGGSSFSFQYGDLGAGVVQGSLPLPLAFDATAQFVLFVPNGTVGADNNDYLVWGADLRQPRTTGDVATPEPLTLLLVGSGLPGLAYWRRRSGRR